MSVQNFELLRVEGYNISKTKNGKYSVASKKGNTAAKVLDKKEYDTFIKQKKAEGKVKPSYALLASLGTIGAAGAAIGLDFLFAKGQHTKRFFKALDLSDLSIFFW